MKRQELVEVLQSRPFHPIRIYVSDGAVYLIRHPDLAMVSPTSVVLGVAEGDRPGPAIERFTIVDLGHITRVEKIQDTARSQPT